LTVTTMARSEQSRTTNSGPATPGHLHPPLGGTLTHRPRSRSGHAQANGMLTQRSPSKGVPLTSSLIDHGISPPANNHEPVDNCGRVDNPHAAPTRPHAGTRSGLRATPTSTPAQRGTRSGLWAPPTNAGQCRSRPVRGQTGPGLRLPALFRFAQCRNGGFGSERSRTD